MVYYGKIDESMDIDFSPVLTPVSNFEISVK